MDGRRKRMRKEGGPLPTRKRTRKEKVFALAAEVFGNHLLREMILNHAIHARNGCLHRSVVSSMRTVGKDWNDSVCKLLHKNGEPLFGITVSNEIFFNYKRSENIGELLEQFTKTFSRSSSILGCIPTVQLRLLEKSFHPDNCKSLHNFLLVCCQGIVQLSAYIPPNAGSLKGIFQDILMPSLQKAKIIFDRGNLDGAILQSDSVTDFLQSIFSATTALKELEMDYHMPNLYQPSVFEGILLPSSLERINILNGFISGDLEMLLVKNNLPNLSSLSLQVRDYKMPIGLLSRIFDNLRRSLKKMLLDRSVPYQLSTNLFRFPIMEKLETIEMVSRCCELDPAICSLEIYLPKLRILKLEDQSADRLAKWTNGSRLSSVQELYLLPRYLKLDLDMEIMSRMHLAFPNVTKLELTSGQILVSGMKYIFLEMTKLVDLKITKLTCKSGEVAIDWDSLLIGITEEATARLWEASSNWETVQLKSDEDASIRKLTKLHTFSLRDLTCNPHKKPFLTDLAFQFAFLKMPRLQNLEVFGRFPISEEMQAKWRVDGRILKYYTMAPLP